MDNPTMLDGKYLDDKYGEAILANGDHILGTIETGSIEIPYVYVNETKIFRREFCAVFVHGNDVNGHEGAYFNIDKRCIKQINLSAHIVPKPIGTDMD
jgi:hypothetical protein